MIDGKDEHELRKQEEEQQQQQQQQQIERDLFTCPVCLEDLASSAFVSFQCGHKLCESCATSYVSSALPTAVEIKCIEPHCSHLLTQQDVRSISNTKLNQEFERFLASSRKTRHFHLLHCPSPSCGEKVFVSPPLGFGQKRNLTCPRCHTSFCSLCKEGSHPFRPCFFSFSLLPSTTKSFHDWLDKNGRRCPSCQIPITKTEGCDHITCQNCTYQFCYLCGGEWGKRHCVRKKAAASVARVSASAVRVSTSVVVGIVFLPAVLLLVGREVWRSHYEDNYALNSVCRKIKGERDNHLVASILSFFTE